MVRSSEKVFQSVKAFSVPNEDVVGMVEVAFRYGLIGGNQFFVETQGVEYAERQAVIFKLDKIDDCQAVFDLLQVLLEAQDALSVQIGNAVVAENFACAVVFAVDVEIQRQPQPACFIEKNGDLMFSSFFITS